MKQASKLPVSLFLLACCTLGHAEENSLTLGGGMAAAPRYSGAREMQAAPIILVDYQTAGGFYASTMRGLGVGTSLGRLSVDAALGMRGERSEDDKSGFGGARGSKELRGMGDVKASATANLRGSYSLFDQLALSANASLPLTRRENGATAGMELTGTLFADSRDKVALSLGATFADRKYMQTYYGVTARQAARTGRKAHAPSAGMYEATLAFAWEHQLDERWNLTGMLGSSILVREAADSPLTRRSTAPTAAMYASYRY